MRFRILGSGYPSYSLGINVQILSITYIRVIINLVLLSTIYFELMKRKKRKNEKKKIEKKDRKKR